jgi:hypothetical protein
MSMNCCIPKELVVLEESLQDMEKYIIQLVMGCLVTRRIPCEKRQTLNLERNPKNILEGRKIGKVFPIHEDEIPAMVKEFL